MLVRGRRLFGLLIGLLCGLLFGLVLQRHHLLFRGVVFGLLIGLLSRR